jgi:transposase
LAVLTRRHNLSGPERAQLKAALSLNRKVFKAYYLKEQIERLWSYTYRGAASASWPNGSTACRWLRLPTFKQLAAMLLEHRDGLVAHYQHRAPFGVVEAINGNLRAFMRWPRAVPTSRCVERGRTVGFLDSL